MLKRIWVEVEDGGESFTGYGEDDADGKTYLTDNEHLLPLLAELKPYADAHGVDVIEIPVDTIPDHSELE